MDRILDILDTFTDTQVHIISLENLSLSYKNMSFFNAQGLVSLLIHLFKCRKKKFDILLGCNVDNIYFQLMIKLLKYRELHTFDEGQIALRDSEWKLGNLDGIVYIRQFSLVGQRRWFLLNKLIGFPIPVSYTHLRAHET